MNSAEAARGGVAVPLPPVPPLIGHRGAAAVAPENTVAGLRAAAAAGARWVEVDAKLTRDGVVVLMHDERLNRTTSGSGDVARHTAVEIAALDAGAWFGPGFTGTGVPTLGEAIATLAELGLGANIEIKPCPGRGAATAEAVAAILAKSWPAQLPPPLLSSFDRDALAAARDAAPGLAIGLLAERLPHDWHEAAARYGCASIHLDHRHVSATEIAAVRDAGLAVLLYTVNEAARAAQLWAMGATAVFTDDPGRLLRQ